MERQCAWCLRLIDTVGVRISPAPVAKVYEASHGMCTICARLWLEEVLRDTAKQPVLVSQVVKADIDYFY